MEVGQLVSDFSAPATSDTTFTLSDYTGKSNIVIYFYPRDSTPGCTTEGLDFTRLHNDFKALDTLIVGVSKDTLRKHENFKAKQAFSFELIADTDEAVCQLFDVIKLKKLYGKEYMGIERSTFFIDKAGVLQHAWRGVKVKGHADEVLETVRNLI